jgi:uncharacterized membrane protein
MVGVYALFFSVLTIQRHASQLTTANDLGIFDQILWNVIHGRGMQRTIEVNFVHWGVHTQPIIYLIALPYLVYPHPETLLVVQSLALALSAVPLYLLARHKLRHGGLALLMAAVYLLSPALQGMNLIDFHPYALAPLFLLWAFYFLHTSRIGGFVVSIVLAIACKEDVALVVALLGLYAVVFLHRPKLGLSVFVIGLGWYALAVGVTQPYFSNGYDKQGWRYEALAWPLPELIRTLFTRPGKWIPYAFAPAKRAYLAGLLWPFGFLPLLAPQVIAVAAPAVMINLLSSFSAQHEPDLYQYNAAILPFLAIGAVQALAWLQRLPRAPRLRRLLTGSVVGLLFAGSLSYHVVYGHTPIAANFHAPHCGAHCAVRSQLLRYIPPKAAVSAQTTLVPHVSQRQSIYEYPQGLSVVDYVLLDVTSPQYAIPSTDQFYASIDSLWQGGDFSLLAAQDGYLLFERQPPAADPGLPESFYSYAFASDAAPSRSIYLDFGPVALIGADMRREREGWIEATLYWRAEEAVPGSYRPSIALGHSDGDLTAWHRLDLPFRWAQRGWRPGEVLRLQIGISMGEGAGAGWGTRWTFYAGVIDDATGTWARPTGAGGASLPSVFQAQIDAREAYLVPLARFLNYWGVSVLQ